MCSSIRIFLWIYELLVSHFITHIVVPEIDPYITPLKNLDYSSYNFIRFRDYLGLGD